MAIENLNPQPRPKLVTESPDSTCNFYLREIKNIDRMDKVENFINDAVTRDFHKFEDPLDLDAFGAAYSEFIKPFLTAKDKAALKSYSGLGYKVINQVARGQWNYDLLGPRTPEQVTNAKRNIDQISTAIARVPSPSTNLSAYRGTNLDSFHTYNINSLSDLPQLEGQFFLEKGFTSTSLSPKQSFADKNFDDPLRRPCDIEITCHIPKEARETIALLSPDLSYNPEQSELIIDKGSLFYISSAEVTPDQSSAHLDMLLIPRNIYDPTYSQT